MLNQASTIQIVGMKNKQNVASEQNKSDHQVFTADLQPCAVGMKATSAFAIRTANVNWAGALAWLKKPTS
jgi:hypothetical protein